MGFVAALKVWIGVGFQRRVGVHSGVQGGMKDGARGAAQGGIQGNLQDGVGSVVAISCPLLHLHPLLHL